MATSRALKGDKLEKRSFHRFFHPVVHLSEVAKTVSHGELA